MDKISLDLDDAIKLEKYLALLIAYGRIHTIHNVLYADGSHLESLQNAEEVLNKQIRPKLRKQNYLGIFFDHSLV